MIISAFEEGGPTPGYTSDGYAPNDKKSMDMPYRFSQSHKVSNIIYPNLIRGLNKYYKKYDDVLKENSFFGIFDSFNVQKYETEEDGYKIWHCQHGPSPRGSMRKLAYMFYLNKEWHWYWGAPTLFKTKKGIKRIYPKPGRLVVFDAYIEHKGTCICKVGRPTLQICDFFYGIQMGY